MGDSLYNLIMHSDPEFWSSDEGYVDFPKDRFLEHTDDDLKAQFQLLDEEAINKLKDLPTLFAVEHENTHTRIGKVVSIEVRTRTLRVRYRFNNDYYPLTRGTLQANSHKLNINESAYEFYRTHWAVKECDISLFYEEYLKTLAGIAQRLRASDKKVQLIYAFNGSGKTRLSREFKELIAPKQIHIGAEDDEQPVRTKILYYNAFTEDLFFWDNDLQRDVERKLRIQPNAYTQWALVEQGQDRNAIDHFQRYTDDKLTPRFNEEYTVKKKDAKGNIVKRTIPAFSEVTFSFERGDDQKTDNVKISKGEESNFIWSIFYAVLEQMIDVLSVVEPSDRETDQFNDLEYIFIDDPVSSLDDNHLIELAADLATLIKFNSSNLKFIISTHNPLFYNLLCNEFGRDNKRSFWRNGEFIEQKWKQKWTSKFRLDKLEDGSQSLVVQPSDSPFSYHLHLLSQLGKIISSNQVEKYHFNLLRNILEKTATFLGYNNWEDLLPESEDGGTNPYAKRIINFASHSKHSGDESKFLEPQDKKILGVVVKHVLSTHRFWQDANQDA